ncbi:MAG: hypothetical protein ACK4HE_05065 [Chitinophagaceae bacterium]
MKQMLLLASVMLATTLFVQAQSKEACKPKVAHRKHFKQQLQLTESQHEKIKVIQQNGRAQRTTILNNNQLSASEKETKLFSLKQEQQQKIDAVLTPAQREQAKLLHKKHKHIGSKYHSTVPPVVR